MNKIPNVSTNNKTMENIDEQLRSLKELKAQLDKKGIKINAYDELIASLEKELENITSIKNSNSAIRDEIIKPITSVIQYSLKESEKSTRINKRSYIIAIISLIFGLIGIFSFLPNKIFNKNKDISTHLIDSLFKKQYFTPKSNKSYILYSHRSNIPYDSDNNIMFISQRFKFEINVFKLNTEFIRDRNSIVIDTIYRVPIQFNLYNNENVLLNNSGFFKIDLKNKNSYFDTEKNCWYLSEGDEFYLLDVRYIIHWIYTKESLIKQNLGVDIITLFNNKSNEILLNQKKGSCQNNLSNHQN